MSKFLDQVTLNVKNRQVKRRIRMEWRDVAAAKRKILRDSKKSEFSDIKIPVNAEFADLRFKNLCERLASLGLDVSARKVDPQQESHFVVTVHF